MDGVGLCAGALGNSGAKASSEGRHPKPSCGGGLDPETHRKYPKHLTARLPRRPVQPLVPRVLACLLAGATQATECGAKRLQASDLESMNKGLLGGRGGLVLSTRSSELGILE